MTLFYDDNYGFWDINDDPVKRNFYFQTQRNSVEKICVDCERTVFIKPEYEVCNACADRREMFGGF
jgi:hypothetical protein